MQRLINAILGSSDIFHQEERSLNGVLFFSVLVNTIALTSEILVPSGVYMAVFTLINFAAFLVMYLLGRTKPRYKMLLLPFFFFSFMIILWIWLFSGGLNKVVLSIAMVFLGISHVVVKGKVRIMVLVLIILMVGVMAVVDIRTPTLIKEQMNPFRFLETLRTGNFLIVGLTLVLSLVSFDQKERKRLAEQKSSSRERFLSIIAHDLKGSLGHVVGMAELRKKMNEDSGQSDPHGLDQLILDSSQRTYELLENLLSWSRVQSGLLTSRPESLSLEQVVEKNLGLQAEQTRRKEIRIQTHVHPELWVHADAYMLDTVMRNLLSNALKFTPHGGEIEIRADESCKENNVCISISDNGVGIEKTHMDKLFDVDSTYSREGTGGESGTGMGLKLCKEFLVLNQGSIEVNSQPGKGSVFTVCLPDAQSLAS